jgi:uncharacterized membrane protein
VSQGTSGAVSLVGTQVALAGSALIAGIALLSDIAGWTPAGEPTLWQQFIIITLGGLFGAFVDSCLGATVQVVYTCPVCKKETERHPVHTCGTETTLKRGLGWLNNDVVNAACTLSAALVGIVFIVIRL